jgi:UDP-N-acetylmuramoyl-tripeptide--D-alanyl-D-alanine ligase
MSALWTSGEAAAATGGRATRPFEATGVSIDSRTVQPGELFVALKGPNQDGHAYLSDAFARGAAAALVDHETNGGPLLVVDDTMAALERLGAARREAVAAKIIGVTGSVGKTGTKEALRAALGAHASAASYNNQWGVPLSLARMPRETRYAVFELGMNHPGELGPLARQVRPHVAIVTTVEATHLGHFASLEEIADAKAEIFEGVEKGGAAVLNRDNRFFDRLASAARARGIGRIVSFGEHEEAAARLLACELQAESSEVTASLEGRELRYRIALPGRHWVLNSLAVLAAVDAVGGDLGAAMRALGALPGIAGRGQRHLLKTPSGGGAFTLIDESYNASPASMRAAIAVLGQAQGPRKIAVLGDMLELGADSGTLHEALAEPLAAAGVNHVFTVGADMRRLHDALPPGLRAAHAASSKEMVPVLEAALRAGDVVMVKGSLGSRMGEIVKALLARGGP